MPELPLRNKEGKRTYPSVPELVGLGRSIRNSGITRDEVEAFVRQFDCDLLGYGFNSLVVRSKAGEVFSFSLNINELGDRSWKRLYYAHGICSQLFPHNIPKLQAVFLPTQRQEEPVTLKREEIIKTTDNAELIKYSPALLEKMRRNMQLVLKGVEHPFTDVLEVCKAYGLPFRFDLANSGNFIISGKNEYYIDEIELLGRGISDAQTESILGYIHDKQIETHNIKNKIARINELFRQ